MSLTLQQSYSKCASEELLSNTYSLGNACKVLMAVHFTAERSCDTLFAYGDRLS